MERTHVFEASDQAEYPRADTPGSAGSAQDASLFQLRSAPAEISCPYDAAHRPLSPPSAYDSRLLDVTVATLLIILVFPLMCLCSLAVVGTSRGPLLYRHARIGRGGVEFECLKLRTMVVDADQNIDRILTKSARRRAQWEALHKLKADPRVTPVGAFMRRYCLDELPQLFNVLAGQMSIVGPRPIVAAEIERFGGDFAIYCSVKPGLTGLWQVSGRHALSYPQRVELDARYARSRTLALDIQILLKTIPIVLLGLNE